MEFHDDAKLCQLYPPSLAALNKAFRKTAECPSDFMYDHQTGKCYKLIAKKATWLDSRLACNALGSHPVIAASSSDTKTLINFMELPSLATNMTYCGYTFWSSGMGFSPPTNLTYVWRPYATKSKDVYLPMKYTNWDLTQPDNAGGIEGFVHIKARKSANWNDLPNSNLLCVLCEVDMD
ncbi:hypothetical protein HELRODRAFT_179786 [Helobdella robusta]|uniref:C-type lectin domain-containing protein n=1 Tax=Helobdella robusta TaxID=6412 RepID=T1FF56_HELRO|nr:hypothetical protein HELRODRAFT_179786 [Helobdella robusta]ESN95186.1 hypothetical protein HELRODRAFT_179786 [Helobdella robusta]